MSWDFDLSDWTRRGCTTSVGGNGAVTCICNHLTNFAVLVVSRYSYSLLYGGWREGEKEREGGRERGREERVGEK